MRKVSLFLIATVCFAAACTGARQPKAASSDAEPQSAASPQMPTDELPLPEVPASLREPAERAGFVVEHFWDAMEFRDTLRSHNSDFMEQNFANFASVLPIAAPSSRKKAVDTLLAKAEADSTAYVLLVEIAEKYLYDPNSPMLDEESYILFLENITESPVLGEYGVIRPRYQLEAALKNRQGTIAADFNYVTRNGKRGSLRKTPVNGLLMLMFYDPDCGHCKEVVESLHTEPLLRQMIDDNELRVLAVYSGEERELWQETASLLPEEWEVAFDTTEVEVRGIYNFRAMPAIYLLDASNRILLKDVLPQTLLQSLYEYKMQ